MPDRIDHFVILRRLGRGGMGEVFAAYDERLDRRVAVKLLRSGLGSRRGGEQANRRLIREAQALARLSHPNVVQVYDKGPAGDDRYYLALEYVEGVPLDTWLGQGPYPLPTILEKFLQIADGLSAAHAAGLVHRDLKPANAIVGSDGRVRVLDFGLARAPLTPPSDEELAAAAARDSTRALDLTATGTIVGTPAYMSPEQFTAGELTTASDQFSFCVALYEAL
ncbi:MAG: serine/threonine protein kinase, partial [Myxococcales bacterium]|nr:serine/threonine protein kinase [Myxococcales bacterium]